MQPKFNLPTPSVSGIFRSWDKGSGREGLILISIRLALRITEALIRLCRRPLRFVLEEQVLSEEAFHTALAEVEATINARPLVSITDDPEDLRALCPADLLVVRPTVPLPPGVFTERDGLHRKWRQVQWIADVFWKRFLTEYVPLLQKRTKWLKPRHNLQVGDLVLLHEDNVPRSAWPLGRISNIRSSPDDLVRSVTVKTANGSYRRPVQKVVLLEAAAE